MRATRRERFLRRRVQELESMKKYALAHKAEKREYDRKRRALLKKEIAAANRKWQLENRELKLARQNDWKLKNPDKVKAQYERDKPRRNAHKKERRANDPSYKMELALRSRMLQAIKSKKARKNSRSVELIGCSFEVLRSHLESLFTLGMTWENYGEWQVDHIRPCASFDLTIPEEQMKCFHYTNLQPLWARDNLMKRDKWSPNDQET